MGKTCPCCGEIHGRGETLVCFETYARKRLAEEPDYYEMVKNLHGKNLVCFCKPKPCHGDVLEKLAKELNEKMQDIKGFEGEYRFLSNFWPCTVKLGGLTFKSTEAAYQAAKTLSYEERVPFTTMTPSESKKAGRQITFRSDWDTVRDDIMEDLLRQKFSTDPLRAKLLATGDCYIEETNYWNDTYWGVCKGIGKNMLGKLIMKIRAELSEAGGGPKARGSEGPSSASATVQAQASATASTTGAEGPVRIAATGHRPPGLFNVPPNESYKLTPKLVSFARDIVIPGLRRKWGEDIVLMSGMALGWDQAIALAAIELQVPFEVSIPYKGQELVWPHQSQVVYHEILVHAKKMNLLHEQPANKAEAVRLLLQRDAYMVDWCDHVCALWNGDPDTGTGKTVMYCDKQGKKSVNCWSLWLQYRDQ